MGRIKAGSGVPRTRVDGDAGVSECLERMTTGRWVPGRSHAELSGKYSVHPDTVKKWATNASRIIRLAIEGDVEDIRAAMLATLGSIVEEARADRDHKAAITAIDVQAKLLGLHVNKLDVTVTPEEASALIAAAKALP